jgi:mannose-1-phosphate guanylyltransferase
MSGIMKDLVCLIMAGGTGTRFWPRSRNSKPKQYLDILGKESLLQSTIDRFSAITDYKNIYIVSSKAQEVILAAQANMIPQKNLIYEPVGKNTLPCIGLSAMLAEKDNPNGIMVVSPADHLIKDHSAFSETVVTAVNVADERNGIVTIGISPTHPATGYGYIKAGKMLPGSRAIRQYEVESFVEKPDIARAVEYLARQNYFWNSGMFVFKISVIMNAIEKYAPELYKSLRKIQSETGKPTFSKVFDSVYRQVDSISIDYGIMEHAENVFLVEGKFDWNDLGSWESVYQVSEGDVNGNVESGPGEGVFINARNSFVHTDEGLVALIGLDDIIVVRDKNAVLVCRRNQSQDVKKVVEWLKVNNKNLLL